MRTTSFMGVGEQPERILVAQVVLAGEGQAARSSSPRTCSGVTPDFVEETPIEGDPIVDSLRQGGQALALQLPEVLPSHALVFAVEDHLLVPLGLIVMRCHWRCCRCRKMV